MYCSKCGAQISDNVAACPYCGQPTGAQQESAGAYQSGGYQQGGAYQPGGYQQGGGAYQPGGYQQGGGAYQPGGGYQQGGGAYQPGGGYQQGGGAYQPGGGYQQGGGAYQPGGGYQQGGGAYQPGGYQQGDGAYQSGGYQQDNGAYQPGGGYQQGGGAYEPGGAAPAASGNRNRIIGIAAVAVALVAVIYLVSKLFFGGGGYEKPIQNMMDGIFKGDAGKILDALPDEMIEETIDQMGLDSRKQLEDVLNEQLLEPMLGMLDSADWSYDYEIGDAEDFSRSELRDVNDMLEAYDLEADDGMHVEVEVTVEYEGDSQDGSTTMDVVKIGGKWYLADMSDINSMGGILN